MPNFAAVAKKMRGLSESAMYEVVEVLRNQRVPDSDGGYVTTPVVVATTKGRYSVAGATEMEIASQMGVNVTGTITIPYVHGIPQGLRGTDRLTRAGKTYNISGILEQTPELSPHLEIMVREA